MINRPEKPFDLSSTKTNQYPRKETRISQKQNISTNTRKGRKDKNPFRFSILSHQPVFSSPFNLPTHAACGHTQTMQPQNKRQITSDKLKGLEPPHIKQQSKEKSKNRGKKSWQWTDKEKAKATLFSAHRQLLLRLDVDRLVGKCR
ncbi:MULTISPECIES: hypothetical protein [unclassified Endozoicomonas]|uniref:hypothetical protein n=1 Tax=unclassified Endozoicomonas TaxID=2644528 RepID=UPI003BB7F81E